MQKRSALFNLNQNADAVSLFRTVRLLLRVDLDRDVVLFFSFVKFYHQIRCTLLTFCHGVWCTCLTALFLTFLLSMYKI